MKVSVLGAGAWGTALAVLAARRGHQVALWTRRVELAKGLATSRENTAYLPGIALGPAIKPTASLLDVAGDVLLLVVPAQHLRSLCMRLRDIPGAPVICAKGIEVESGALMSEVVGDALPERPLAVLTGPNFAAEVARDLPAAATVAASTPELGEAVVTALGGPTFRPYVSDDVIGSQVGGALKNVLAIACGIAAGRGFGDNARAALITRGLAEISRLAVALGGRAETVMGLSGVGDITLTCTSTQSRNYALGLALGSGETMESLMRGRITVAEGVATSRAVAQLAARSGVDMPIASATYALLHEGAGLESTIGAVLSRPFRNEAERR
jgi:glycerol-3-phosphate dehydrogenase (NAD(P)+)